MPIVRGCHLPDDLRYSAENRIRFRELDHGVVRSGMTMAAAALAGRPVAAERNFKTADGFAGCVP